MIFLSAIILNALEPVWQPQKHRGNQIENEPRVSCLWVFGSYETNEEMGNFMKKLLLLVAALFVIAIPAQAQDSTTSAVVEGETTSADNRGDSIIFVGISPFGLHLPTLATQPLSLGVHLGDSLLLAVESGSRDFTVKGTKNDELSGTYSNQGIYARWFTGNSFNFLLGYHKRSLEVVYDYEIKVATIAVPLTSDVTYEANVATLGFGNQWLTDFGMVIGMDWLLLSSVTGSSFDFSTPALPGNVPLDATTQTKLDKAKQDANDLLDLASSIPGILVLTIGYSF